MAKFLERLKTLDNTATSITSISAYMQLQPPQVAAETWGKSFFNPSFSDDQRLAHLYLLNEVLHKQAKQHTNSANPFSQAFSKPLIRAFASIASKELLEPSSSSTSCILSKFQRVLGIWRDRNVLPSATLSSLKAALDNPDHVLSTESDLVLLSSSSTSTTSSSANNRINSDSIMGSPSSSSVHSAFSSQSSIDSVAAATVPHYNSIPYNKYNNQEHDIEYRPPSPLAILEREVLGSSSSLSMMSSTRKSVTASGESELMEEAFSQVKRFLSTIESAEIRSTFSHENVISSGIRANIEKTFVVEDVLTAAASSDTAESTSLGGKSDDNAEIATVQKPHAQRMLSLLIASMSRPNSSSSVMIPTSTTTTTLEKSSLMAQSVPFPNPTTTLHSAIEKVETHVQNLRNEKRVREETLAALNALFQREENVSERDGSAVADATSRLMIITAVKRAAIQLSNKRNKEKKAITEAAEAAAAVAAAAMVVANAASEITEAQQQQQQQQQPKRQKGDETDKEQEAKTRTARTEASSEKYGQDAPPLQQQTSSQDFMTGAALSVASILASAVGGSSGMEMSVNDLHRIRGSTSSSSSSLASSSSLLGDYGPRYHYNQSIDSQYPEQFQQQQQYPQQPQTRRDVSGFPPSSSSLSSSSEIPLGPPPQYAAPFYSPQALYSSALGPPPQPPSSRQRLPPPPPSIVGGIPGSGGNVGSNVDDFGAIYTPGNARPTYYQNVDYDRSYDTNVGMPPALVPRSSVVTPSSGVIGGGLLPPSELLMRGRQQQQSYYPPQPSSSSSSLSFSSSSHRVPRVDPPAWYQEGNNSNAPPPMTIPRQYEQQQQQQQQPPQQQYYQNR